jgi:CRP/FNR family transcriptional regulator, cyclic AMP receptor protein
VFAPTRFQPVKSSVAVQVSLNAPAILRPILREGLTQAPPLPRRKPVFGEEGFVDEALGANHSIAEVSPPSPEAASQNRPGEIDPLYLFACRAEWERRSDTSSAWELISAAESPHEDTRANARQLLASSRHLEGGGSAAVTGFQVFKPRRYRTVEANMKTPYGLEIIENCSQCFCRKAGFFCGLSSGVVESLDQVSHHSTMPAGAILFVEGQISRGIFILCSGKVKLSTASREGKVLILKTVEAGEVLGLSAAVSGASYEMTAETAMPCQLNFVGRRDLLEMLHAHSEVGVNAAQSLSSDFQSAYRDIRDLVMARSSEGKLARLLLSFSPKQTGCDELHLKSVMTHEEMAQRIGSSRETVTRLLTELKRKQLIRLDGPTLVIRSRIALETLAV